MRITESKLRRIIRSVIIENTNPVIRRGHYDELDGFMDLRGNAEESVKDLVRNIEEFITDDIKNYSFSEVVNLQWDDYGRIVDIYTYLANYRFDRRRHIVNNRNMDTKYLSFEISSYPLTSGEARIEDGWYDPGLTKDKIQNKLGSTKSNNEFSCQQFEFKCTSLSHRVPRLVAKLHDLKIRVYREENSKGESNILLQLLP